MAAIGSSTFSDGNCDEAGLLKEELFPNGYDYGNN